MKVYFNIKIMLYSIFGTVLGNVILESLDVGSIFNLLLSFEKGNCMTNIRDFIDKKDEASWREISKSTLPEYFINEYRNKVDWHYISSYQKLSEDFIRKFRNRVDWYAICCKQNLSEEFIREFMKKIDQRWVFRYQKLSENFIREFEIERGNWEYISHYQKLSEEFVREFRNRVNWYYIYRYQKLSTSFTREFRGVIQWACPSNDYYSDPNYSD